MRVRLLFCGVLVLLCAWVASAGDPASGRRPGPGPRAAVRAAGRAAKAPESKCLGCHGSFDKIIEASASYVAPSGEKTSPHKYVPHDSKKVEDVPECTLCHTAHPLDPLPSKGSTDLSKLGVSWCYDACHHEKKLTSCKECHP